MTGRHARLTSGLGLAVLALSVTVCVTFLIRSIACHLLPWVVALSSASFSTLVFLIFYIQKRRSGAKLVASEARYRTLFETAQDGIVTLDAVSGRVLDINPFLLHLLGYPKDEMIGRKLQEICMLKNTAVSPTDFLELLTVPAARYKDLSIRTKTGSMMEVECVSNTYQVKKTQVIQCNIRDVCERKRTEEAMRARNAELETLGQTQEDTKKAMLNILDDLEAAKARIEAEKIQAEAMLASIGDGVVAADTDGKIVILNKSAADMLHCHAADVIGKPFPDVWTVEDASGQPIPPSKQPVQRALASAKIVTTTYYYVRKDQSKFPVAITVTPIVINGKVVGTIDVFRDITRENEVDKAKSEFVSLASHQLRTPLGIAKWYLEAVKKEKYFKHAPKTTLAYFEEIYKSNERVIALVRELLSVSLIDQGRIKNNPKPTDIPTLLTEVYKEMSIAALKRNVALELVIKPAAVPKISIDAFRFHEVIENLIANALEYTPSSGVVRIILGTVGKKIITISIKDTGMGISPRDQKKLFTKFFRSEQGAASNTEGSGLGLYVVKSYVESWGGQVTVRSEIGKGSTFTISLPIKEMRAT